MPSPTTLQQRWRRPAAPTSLPARAGALVLTGLLLFGGLTLVAQQPALQKRGGVVAMSVLFAMVLFQIDILGASQERLRTRLGRRHRSRAQGTTASRTPTRTCRSPAASPARRTARSRTSVRW